MNKRIRKKKERQRGYKQMHMIDAGFIEVEFNNWRVREYDLRILVDGKYVPVKDTEYANTDHGPLNLTPDGLSWR